MNNRLTTMLIVLAVPGGLLATVMAPAQAAVPCIPTFYMKMDAAEQCARTAGGAATTVTFSGRMGIDKLSVERCVVTLTASTDTGWAAGVTPTVAVFTSTTPQSFNCTVVVPAGTLQNQTASLSVKCHAQAGGLEYNAETKGLIRVEPFFRPSLSSSAPFKQIYPGGQACFTLRVNNTGNAIDSFELEILNLRDLAGKQWTVVLSVGTLPNVAPGGSKPFCLIAQSSRDRAIWKSEPTVVLVKATSQCAEDLEQVVSTTFQLTVYVRGTWLPNLSTGALSLVLSLAAAYWTFVLVRRT